MLDALDEVPQEKRISLLENLKRFAKNYRCPMIGTSRIVGYSGGFVDGVKEVEIVPFSQQQIEQYIETWFRNAAECLNNTVSPSELIRELRNKPQIRGLAQNPLLLSLICSLYQEKGLMPVRRWQVYEKTLEYMLGNWYIDNRRQIPNTAWIAAKQELLGEIAYQFSCESKEVFTMHDLRSQIEKYLQNQCVSTDFRSIKTSDIIAELSEQDGILQKLSRDGKQYVFLHRTFHEYLTASYLKRSIETDLNRGISLVRKYLWEYEWYETFSLLAGLLEDPIPLLQAITKEKDDIFHSLLLLAGHCIAECEDTLHPLMLKILEKIYKLWCSNPSVNFLGLTVKRLACTNSVMLEKLLGRSLNDRSKEVRRATVQILGEIATPQLTEDLKKTLKDCDTYVSIWSALALGRIGNAEAIKALIQALDEPKSNVRQWVFIALKKIEISELLLQQITNKINIPSNDYSMSKIELSCQEFIDKIIHLENTKIGINYKNIHNLLVKSLAENFYFIYSHFRKEAIILLGEIGDCYYIEELIRVIQPLDSDVRRWVTAALQTIKNLQVVEARVKAYRKNQDDLITDIRDFLEKDTFKIYQASTQLINSEDSKLSKRILTELEKIDCGKLANALIQNLYHCCKDVRREATIALGKIGNPQAVEILSETLSDPDNEIRREATIALGKIGNPQAVEILSQALNNRHSKIRREATIALGAVDTPYALTLLTQLLNDLDGDIRWRAAVSLGEIGSSQAIEVLIKALNHSDGDVRREAATALGEIGSPQAVEALIHHFKKNNHDEDRRWVAAALGKVKWATVGLSNLRNTQILESLIPDLDDSDSYVRRWIAVAIGRIRDPKAVEALIDALNDRDRNVRKHGCDRIRIG